MPYSTRCAPDGSDAQRVRYAFRLVLSRPPQTAELSRLERLYTGSLARFEKLRTLHGEKAMWRLLEELGDAVERIPVDVPVPQDIDTLEDYERVLGA